MNFFDAIKDLFLIKSLRKRVMYTAFFAFIYRLGTFVLLPWLDPAQVLEKIQQAKEQSFWDRVFATSFDTHSLFSLGIGPYITASIFVQLSSFVIPYFQRLEKEGQIGKSKLEVWTRWLTIPIAIVQSLMQLYNTRRDLVMVQSGNMFLWYYLSSVLLMVVGAVFSMWLADQITSKGLSNGSSVLIMVNTLATLPKGIVSEVNFSEHGVFFLVIEFIIMLAIVFSVILFMQGVRRVTLQYARQIVSGYGYSPNVRQYFPIKMNATGVMPIITAQVFVGLFTFLFQTLDKKLHVPYTDAIHTALKDQFGWQYNLFQGLVIFAMTMMYMTVFVNPNKIADELKRSNAFVSGVRPGQATANLIDKISTRVVFVGALFLVFISIIPAIVVADPINIHKDFAPFYGGTKLLIVVGVMSNMIEQIEGHFNMHYYDKMMQRSQDMPRI